MDDSAGTLDEEFEALNSIYGDGTITLHGSNKQDTVGILKLPALPTSFSLSFPRDYPEERPRILGTHSTGGAGKGEGEAAVGVLREVLEKVYQPGQVCLFDMVEESTLLLGPSHGSNQDTSEGVAQRSVDLSSTSAADQSLTEGPASPFPVPTWVLSEPWTVNKSLFVARVCPISSASDVTDAVASLLATNKKVATATHNIKSWRVRDAHASSRVVQDYDDDGESAAGGRLLHLMQLMHVWNVLVVVTRWYGGVKLGPDRFRIINNVAREALIKGGFVKDEKLKSKSSTRK